MLSSFRPLCILSSILLSTVIVQSAVHLPACHQIPKVLCCTERVIEKCLSGCVSYIEEKCPHKLNLFEKTDSNEEESEEEGARVVDNSVVNHLDSDSLRPPQRVTVPPQSAYPQQMERDEETPRRAPQGGDYRALNSAYPVTEVTDKDLTTECGVAESRPPYSPCLSRKTTDDLFLSCCRQHVPSNCHSLCSFEHREHVAAELLIAAVSQEKCDLAHVSKILYCANQNRDNRPCCEYLGLSGPDLGVGNRCLRMCNIGRSGDAINTITKDDLVCLSNWNVVMYCARAGLRTIN